jgi:hypothetical protein
MDIQKNNAVVERFDALINTQELDLLPMLCTQDMVNHTLLPERPQGLRGTREFLETAGRSHWLTDGWRDRVVSNR